MKQKSSIHNIIALWRCLGKKRRIQFFFYFILLISSILAEIVSIGAVVPFLSALTKPELLLESDWFQPVNTFFNIQSATELLFPLTLTFITVVVCSAVIRILLLWYNTRLTAAMGIQLRTDVYGKALYQPYEYHVQQNSSQLISLATEKVGAAISAGVMHVLLLGSATLLSSAIIITLVLLNPLVAGLTFLILGGGYVFIGWLVRVRIRLNGDIIAHNQPEAVKCLQEGLGGIREVIMDNSQQFFCRSYSQAATNILQAMMQNGFLGGLPKSLLEMLAITLIAVLAYVLQANASGQQNILPILGALALGAQRLLPSLQQIYLSWSIINSNQAIIADVVTQLYSLTPDVMETEDKSDFLELTDSIVLQDLGFQYQGSAEPVLKDINLRISKGSRTGFIGTTGSGKSTLLDILMGLLTPSQGQLLVDGIAIGRDTVRAWQRNIAHVSQSIFLSDGSMAENIAFGVAPDQIDPERVKQAAQHAQIDDFITGLPNGYQTMIGERGVRLSGGQRQRIGVARALYKQATVLVLDEATSALDSATEKKLMQAIDAVGDRLTVIIIAHRLSTLKNCDTVIELSHGKVARQGSYNEIVVSEQTHGS